MGKVLPRFLPVESACRKLECTEAELKRFVQEGALNMYFELFGGDVVAAPLPDEAFCNRDPVVKRLSYGAYGWNATYKLSAPDETIESTGATLRGIFLLEGTVDCQDIRRLGSAELNVFGPVDGEDAKRMRDEAPHLLPWEKFSFLTVDSFPKHTLHWSDMLFLGTEIDHLLSGQMVPNTARIGSSIATPASLPNNRSDDLVALLNASIKFWANAVQDDPATHPKSCDVESWLTKEGLSASKAKAGASIIRPTWAHNGRRPDD